MGRITLLSLKTLLLAYQVQVDPRPVVEEVLDRPCHLPYRHPYRRPCLLPCCRPSNPSIPEGNFNKTEYLAKSLRRTFNFLNITCDVGAFLRGPPGLGGDNLGFSPLANQSFLSGGGTGVEIVAIDTSPEKKIQNGSNTGLRAQRIPFLPMILKDSLQAWYMRSISSRFDASSGLSSIICD
jgi:hypothetical protein